MTMTSRWRTGVSRRSTGLAVGAITAVAALTLSACGSSSDSAGSSSGSAAATGAAKGTIKVWAQQGQPGEVKAAQDEVAAFNASQSDIKVELTLLPQATYGQTLATTSVDKLPDAFEFDGETLGALVYAQKLAPLEGSVSKATLDAQLPSLQAEGTYPGDGKRYSVSQYDSGLGLWGNKALLTAAGVTYPTTIDKAWTAQQFYDAVAKVAAKATGGKGLDIKENYAGTWPGYAFTPIVASSGYPLVKDGQATGNLNNAAVAASFAAFAKLRAQTDPNTDDKAFTAKRVALSWCGHWCYPDYSKALGNDLVLIPLPDFGNGTKSGQGSHSWAISCWFAESGRGREVPRLRRSRRADQGRHRRQRCRAGYADGHRRQRAVQGGRTSGAVRRPAGQDLRQQPAHQGLRHRPSHDQSRVAGDQRQVLAGLLEHLEGR